MGLKEAKFYILMATGDIAPVWFCGTYLIMILYIVYRLSECVRKVDYIVQLPVCDSWDPTCIIIVNVDKLNIISEFLTSQL